MKKLEPVSLEDIRAARERIANDVVRTPLLRLNVENASNEIFIKIENIQPIGSFKLRGAGNAIRLADKELLKKGVWTASAGNMAQGVAWHTRRLGLKCTIVVPDNAPDRKLEAIKKLGARIIKVPYMEWIEVLKNHHYEELDGLFIHPFENRDVMAGNGTIGLEILEDLPDVDIIIVPYGGGGLSCGIASAVRAIKKNIKLYACEVETAAPVAAAFKEGKPIDIEFISSFVDGIGAPIVFPAMWPLVKKLLDGSLVVGLKEIAEVIKLLIEKNNLVAEGAGAASIAAALNSKVKEKKIACVVSGGNIDSSKIVNILQGKVP